MSVASGEKASLKNLKNLNKSKLTPKKADSDKAVSFVNNRTFPCCRSNADPMEGSLDHVRIMFEITESHSENRLLL
jgi:hypothetical protein